MEYEQEMEYEEKLKQVGGCSGFGGLGVWGFAVRGFGGLGVWGFAVLGFGVWGFGGF